MNAKLEALMSAYRIKPKRNKRKIKKNQQKSPERARKQPVLKNSIKSMWSLNIEKSKKKATRESFSVLPKRSDSNLSLSRYLNSSLDEDIEKLDSLTSKNSSARLDWISVKQQIIELSVNKKLIPIWETDEITDEKPENLLISSKGLTGNNEPRQFLGYKSRIKSLDNLLIV